jgi:hypothetical protein
MHMTWVPDQQAAGHTDAEHLDGVPWYDAPVPPRFHRCKPQTRGWYKTSFIERCACGAIRSQGSYGWISKNERRRGGEP